MFGTLPQQKPLRWL